MGGGLREQRKLLSDQVGADELAMLGESAQPDLAGIVRRHGEFGEVADVDQELGRRQPHVQGGEQALPAGERHCLAAALLKNAIGVVE